MISTPLPESAVAAYLRKLEVRVKPHGVKVGSYPRWAKRNNTVTLVGRDRAYLESLVDEVVANVEGERVYNEGEDDEKPAAEAQAQTQTHTQTQKKQPSDEE